METDTLGHYRIIERIGEGGMGVVYKARDTHLDRFVALKVVREGFTDPGRQRRFVTEARAASALNHPNILTVHDINQDQGVVFIVMEYLDGRTLSEAIGRKGLRVADAIGMAIQVAAALEAAHAAGVVHRDLKPANIMITSGGVVKVLDFGLAKLLQPETAAADKATITAQPVTAHGVILGTAAYMSPEQAEGHPIDARSDIFAFGAVLYEMLTGTPAFARNSPISTLTAVMRDMPVPVHECVNGVPDELERLVLMCLQKDPARRIQHIADVRILLERLKEDTESSVRAPTGVSTVPARRFGRRRVLLATAAAGVVLAGLAATLYWYRSGATREVTQGAQTGFTFDDGLTLFPALSPDGSLAAFASDRSGEDNLDVYVQQAAGTQAIRLTRDPADDSMPAFSPDGSKIVFRSERDGGGIYVVDALGGPARKLAARGLFPRFSPDGHRISVVDPPAGAGSAVGSGIFLIAVDGGLPVALQPDLAVSSLSQGPVWSPDGKYIVVAANNRKVPGPADWWVVPVDDGPPVATGARLAASVRPGQPFYPAVWTPQGILHVAGGPVEGAHLFLAPPPAADLRIKGPFRRLTSGTEMLYGVAASKDGRLLYPLLDWTPNYWMVGLDSRHGTILGTARRITSDTTTKLQATISRDGSRMGYVNLLSVRDQKIELCIRDVRTGTETRIPVSGRTTGVTLHLNADGSFVAFRDWGATKVVTYLARTDGSSKTLFCDDCYMLRFTSQPRTAYIYKGNAVFRRDLDTRADTRLLDIPVERINDVSASADDRWVAVAVDNADRTADIGVASLSRLPIAERDLTIVAHDDRHLSSPRWSADGTLLYYLSQRDGFLCIWAQRLDPATRKAVGGPFAVQHQHAARSGRFGPSGAFSFDVAQNALLFNLAETRGNLWTANLTDHLGGRP